MTVTTANGSTLGPKGLVKITFKLNNYSYDQEFIVCEKLSRPLILGIDFLQENRIGTQWGDDGKLKLTYQDQVICALDITEIPNRVWLRKACYAPPKTLLVIEAIAQVDNTDLGNWFEITSTKEWENEFPNVRIIPTLVTINAGYEIALPMVVVNLNEEGILLPGGKIMAKLEIKEITVSEINIDTSPLKLAEIDCSFKENWDDEDLEEEETKFIRSPADIQAHRKVLLDDAEVSPFYREQLEELCQDFDTIFSKDSSDIGETPLITMDIDTGNSPPISQRPYTLALKHAEWVKKELEILEQAGIIERSISPWASPIVIVPKRTAPGEPPKRRLCVDYRALNSLLPPVTKAFSKAKGILSLVPLPKIDTIYAKLAGSTIYTSLDLRSGYHHIALSPESQKKSAFVTPLGKFEFKKVPFGLAQAPAYFQRLIDQVLVGLDFAFGYLDDILIYSKDVEQHLQHIRIVFTRVKEARLKLKASKCCFFKKHLHYLGHLISAEGIKPIKEKLVSLEKMPPPRTPKEIKQFLGLAGYYRKFVPRFSDIARPMTALTKKDTEFIWSETCQKSFELLKQYLVEEPILKFPDPELPYTLFTDASKYAYAAVLAQAYPHPEREGKRILHPITYLSGLFKGSQLNWAALTKEAYAIYMAVKKLSFYLEGAHVDLYSDHLPLKKFLLRNTLNSKVNNWAIEIEQYRIEFHYIKGIKNTLADTMSRLVEIDPSIQQEREPPCQEYGYAVFDEMPPVEEIHSEREGEIFLIYVEEVKDPGDEDEKEVELNPEQWQKWQTQDAFCQRIMAQLDQKQMEPRQPYDIKENILYRYIKENEESFEAVVVPLTLLPYILKLIHNDAGHNGSTRTYLLARRLYYWKGMKQDIQKYIRRCEACQRFNQNVVKYAQLHFDVPKIPMEFISMDLIGPFPASKSGNKYALTVICMLTGYVFVAPIPNKETNTVVKAYIENVYKGFGGSRKILSDNGTEFRSGLFTTVAKELGVEFKLYTPPYHPQSNGRIEGFHRFLKACMSKHITSTVEWDEVVPLATAAYNFFPNEHSKESSFFLMFGRDPYVPLNTILEPKIRYMGNDEGIISLEAMKNIYQVVAENLKKARQRRDTQLQPPIRKLQIGDSVMIKNHEAQAWDKKFIGDFRIIAFPGPNQVEVRSAVGKERIAHLSDVKYVYPADRVISNLPDATFGRAQKLRLKPNHIPDLQWTLSFSTHTNFVTTEALPRSCFQQITNTTNSFTTSVPTIRIQ